MERLRLWHKTKLGLITFLIAELALAYVIASLAIDSGNLWEYALTIILLVGSIQNFVKFIRKVLHADH